jgi:CDP-glucose 4,6-dehydratase
VTARCGNIYGSGDLNWSRLIPGVIRWLYNNEQPIIRSDGKFLRDYVYVEDAVHAYMLMAQHADKDDVVGKAFNFGPGRPVSVLEVVDALRKIMGKAEIEPIIQNEAKSEIRDQFLDSTRAREVLGWEPRFSLEEGLSRTVDWYVNYLKANGN